MISWLLVGASVIFKNLDEKFRPTTTNFYNIIFWLMRFLRAAANNTQNSNKKHLPTASPFVM